MLFINGDETHVVVRSDDRDQQGRLIRGGKRKLYAKFERGAAPAHARLEGVKLFAMTNRPPEIDAGRWLGCYDSVADQERRGWTDDERALIEQRLVQLGYHVVENPKVPAPYGNYDKHRKVAGRRTVEHAISDIVGAYETAGFDVEQAVAYERQEGNNPQVIAALEALNVPVEGEDAEPLIAA